MDNHSESFWPSVCQRCGDPTSRFHQYAGMFVCDVCRAGSSSSVVRPQSRPGKLSRLWAWLWGLTLVAAFAIPAGAATTIALPFQVLRGAEGSTVVLYDGPIPAVGVCTVVASDAGNNRSVHPGNNLTLESAGQTVLFADVERAPNVSTPGSNPITPGPTGVVTLTFGPDETYSADLGLEFSCESSTTTTTSMTTTTSTEGATTTSIPTSSTTLGGSTTTSVLLTTTTGGSERVLPATGASPWVPLGGSVLLMAGLGVLGASRER